MPSMETCEYCGSQNATTHCSECGKDLCLVCQIKDEAGNTKCLSCGDIETIPLTDEDVEDVSSAIPFEKQEDD